MLPPSAVPDTLDRLAGQVVLSGFEGLDPPEPLLAAAARGRLGGFVLFRRNVQDAAQVASLNTALAAACLPDLPPWIAVDQEGGRVQRLGPPVLQLPPMRVLGSVDNASLTEEAASVLGRQLAMLGFNLDFAPVLDVDTNPDNPVIGDRAFARDPAVVTRHAGAFAAGLMAGGVAACGKHFPGHGDTAQDSHLALPRLPHAPERLEAIELAPFRRLAPQLPAIMTAHVVYEALDAARPATLSPAVVTGLLRAQLGFAGVVFSDDLEMAAIASHHGVPEAACQAVAAGCDAVLICKHHDLALETVEALEARARAEPAFAARLEEAVARGLAVRRRFPPRALPAAGIRTVLEAALGGLPARLSQHLEA